MERLQLKEVAVLKINYASKHFEALGHSNIKLEVITIWQDLRDEVLGKGDEFG